MPTVFTVGDPARAIDLERRYGRPAPHDAETPSGAVRVRIRTRIKSGAVLPPAGGKQGIPSNFERSFKVLRERHSSAPTAFFLAAAVLLVAWAGWFFGAQVNVVKISERARIEAGPGARRIGSPNGGVVRRAILPLGERVAAGDTLLELDASAARGRLLIEGADQAAAKAELEALRHQLQLEEVALAERVRATQGLARPAGRQVVAAREEAELAERELARNEALASDGRIALMDLDRLRASTKVKQAMVDSRQAEVNLLLQEALATRTAAAANVERLRREVARLEGEQLAWTKRRSATSSSISRRVVRSPIAGRIGDSARLLPGSVVTRGQYVATIIPDAPLRIRAEFDVRQSLGWLRKGQPAVLTLDAFPNTRFGSLKGRVASVGAENLEGLQQIELDLLPGANSTIPVIHGLTGRVEVLVESDSPARLVLRYLGELIRPKSQVVQQPSEAPR